MSNTAAQIQTALHKVSPWAEELHCGLVRAPLVLWVRETLCDVYIMYQESHVGVFWQHNFWEKKKCSILIFIRILVIMYNYYSYKIYNNNILLQLLHNKHVNRDFWLCSLACCEVLNLVAFTDRTEVCPLHQYYKIPDIMYTSWSVSLTQSTRTILTKQH